MTRVIQRLCSTGGACTAGRTVLCVIHQPASEVFELFDTLALLAEGATVYFGPAAAAIDLFGAAGFPAPRSRSASDHLLHTINKDFGDAHAVAQNVKTCAPCCVLCALVARATDGRLPRRLLAAYEASPTRDARDARIAACTTSPGVVFEPGRTPPSMWSQTAVLTQRFLTNNARDIGVFWMRLAMYFMLCLCIAFIYFRMDKSWRNVYSRAALLFFCVAFLCFMSSACTLARIFRSRAYNARAQSAAFLRSWRT